MKKLSRMLALVMALALCLGAFQSVATAEELSEVDLIYWCGANPDQKDSEMVLTEMKKVAKEALNVNLDMVIVATSEIKEKFNKAMAAQERIDLVWTGYVQSIQELVNLGAIQPLDDLMAEYGQDLIASIDERLLDAHRSADGKLYQFPAWQGLVGGRSALYIPKDVVDATVGEAWMGELEDLMYANYRNYSAEAINAVYDKFEELLAAAKEADMLGLGYNFGYPLYNWWWQKSAVAGVGTYGYVAWGDDTFTVIPKTEEIGWIETRKTMAEWYEKGYIRADVASVDGASEDWTRGWKDPVSDQCYINYSHNGFTDDLSKELSGFNKELYAIHCQPDCETILGNATGTSIPFTAKEPERAMMFMNWLVAGDEQAVEFYNLYAYGIEGTHYEWNEDHTEITVFGGAGQASADFDWGQRPWMMGTLLNAYSCAVYPASYYQELIALQENAYTSPLLGFSFDYSDVEIEYNLLSSIDKEYGDMLNRGYLGTADLEAKVEEYNDKMNAAGLQTVVDAIQEQVTNFVTENNRTW